MATHPHCNSPQDLRKAIEQLKKGTFPSQIEDDILRFWDISPTSKEGIIQVLHFLSFVDKDGKRTEKGEQVFSSEDSQVFDRQFGECVKSAYSELFRNSGDHTWFLKAYQLIDFFRVTDKTSKSIGRLQADTFQVLVDFLSISYIYPLKPVDLRLNARIEFNIPNDGSKETYDNIFQSAREKLLNE